MIYAAEFGTGQVFWSILWFFLFFLWIWLVISVFGDIMRSDMSGWAKAMWSLGIIILPYLGVFMYLIVNGSSMSERDAQAARDRQAAIDSYIRETAGGGGSSAEEIAKLAELHQSGKLTDDEYARAKARALGS